MEYDTEEQQVEALKEWWAENGKAVVAGVVLGGALIGGWTFWKGHQEKQVVAASDTFSLTMEAIDTSDSERALELASQLQEELPKHLYAAYANFAAARVAVENNDLQEAADRLQWVVDNARQKDVQVIAKVRLARVLGATGDVDAALASLPNGFPESFAGLVEEARGDLLFLSGDVDGARTAYEAASASQNVANREGLDMKLNDLALPAEPVESASESAS
ncbi:MAG: tetratricopeptide repeat protein [Granulosicoccus sp.]|nr:tetratricopeptide repeat protein [Granulosicoccus sp.]